MELTANTRKPQGDIIFALDIGTRTVVGMLGRVIDDKYTIIDYFVQPHTKRAMVDGQIEDIKQVAKIVEMVKNELEQRNGITLTSACIAAAGRALKTIRITHDFDVSDKEIITEEIVSSIEMETIQLAQAEIDEENKNKNTLFYCVGHNVVNYRLDEYKIMSLAGHKGNTVGIDMVVAFLPSVVVEGLYSVMELVGLEVRSLTLEPIAAMNVIVPQEIRLINVALVDIGAGTSDIAISKEGAIIAYAMATIAGDEITEEIIRAFLVDFNTAEKIKHLASAGEPIVYDDIFGIEHTIEKDEFDAKVSPCVETLADTICKAIVDINGSSPQAVFLVGGGSLTKDLPQYVAQRLGIDDNHVAVGNHRFIKQVDLGGFELDAEFITPIGIGLTATTDAGYDFSVITINGEKIRVFDTKQLEIFQLLSLAGYRTTDIMGHSGRSLTYTLNGNRATVKGEALVPAEIKVNGNPAALTTKVTQGDNVEITPAKSGENAHARLKDVIDYSKYSGGFVKIGERSLSFGLKVFVGGEAKLPDYEIQPLDEITTGGILTLGDLIFSLDTDFTDNITVNGEAAGEGYILKNGDRIELLAEAAAPMPEVQSEPVQSEPVIQEKKEPKGDAITLTLNGKRMTLPPTMIEGEQHRFLELLNYLNIDSTTPKGDIVLTLNGAFANFNDILNDGDSAVISWKEL